MAILEPKPTIIFLWQEGLSLATFSGWLKSLSFKVKEDNVSFIAVEVSTPSAKQALSQSLQFKLPNGLVIKGDFSLSEVGYWIMEIGNGFTPLR